MSQQKDVDPTCYAEPAGHGVQFDLTEDPDELYNLWGEPEHQERKKERLLRFLHAEMGKEPVPMPRVWCA